MCHRLRSCDKLHPRSCLDVRPRAVIDVCAVWVAGRKEIKPSHTSSPPSCLCLRGFLQGELCPQNNMEGAALVCRVCFSGRFLSVRLAWWGLLTGSWEQHWWNLKHFSDNLCNSKSKYIFPFFITTSFCGQSTGRTSGFHMLWIVTENLEFPWVRASPATSGLLGGWQPISRSLTGNWH